MIRQDSLIQQEILRTYCINKSLEAETGDILETLRRTKAQEFSKSLAPYKGKVKVLRIKRLWLNSDVLPWTYSMWKEMEYGVSLSGRFSKRWASVSGKIRPDMSGEAVYVGENELTYINILFDDNSYHRVLIREAPEWLLVREGEQVSLEYSVKDVRADNLSFSDMIKDPSEFITVKYVPLYK